MPPYAVSNLLLKPIHWAHLSSIPGNGCKDGPGLANGNLNSQPSPDPKLWSWMIHGTWMNLDECGKTNQLYNIYYILIYIYIINNPRDHHLLCFFTIPGIHWVSHILLVAGLHRGVTARPYAMSTGARFRWPKRLTAYGGLFKMGGSPSHHRFQYCYYSLVSWLGWFDSPIVGSFHVFVFQQNPSVNLIFLE